MTKADKRAKKVEKAMRLTWESLESHLPWAHRKSSEGAVFHKKAIKSYLEIMNLLYDLY